MAAHALSWTHDVARKGELEGFSTLARFILLALSGWADHHKQSWPTQTELATFTGASERNISRAVKELADAKVVTFLRGKNPDGGVTNIYTIALIPDDIAAKDSKPISVQVDPGEARPLFDEPDERFAGVRLPLWLKRSKLKVVPEWVPMQTWVDFEIARNERKKRITDPARKRLIERLENIRLEHDEEYAVLSIEQSIERGWTSFYELKDQYLQELEKRREPKIVTRESKKNRGTVFFVKVAVYPDGTEKIVGVDGQRKMTPEEIEEWDRQEAERRRRLEAEVGW